MEQTSSTFELRLPAMLLDVCCNVAAAQTGNSRRLSAVTAGGEDVEISVRCEKEWILLLFQGAAGSIIDVLNDQWRCSIESINVMPQPSLRTHVAQSFSAGKCQPRISDHPATGVEENGETTCKKPAATDVLVHQALVHNQALVHRTSEQQQSEKHVTSNEMKTESGQLQRKSQRVQEREQRLSTDVAEVDGENAALNKTGTRGMHAKISKRTQNSCKNSQKQKKPSAGRVFMCGVSSESMMDDAVHSCMGSDQSDASVDEDLIEDTSPLGGAGDNQLHMKHIKDVDNEEGNRTEVVRTARKKRRTITDPNVQPYLCPECGHPFIVAISLMKHIASTHRQLPNYAAIVNAAEDMRASRLKAASAISVSCPVCQRDMRGTRVFMHMRKFHEDDSDFDSLMMLAKKQYYAERERVYQLNDWGRERVPCPHCGMARARRRLSHHINYQCKENAERRKFLRCRHCGYGTHRTDRLAQHMKLHQDGTNFICDHCGKRYVSQAGLTVHLRQKHQEAKRNPILSHSCPLCRKTFIHESRLKKHMTIHADDRCHVCDICGKTFKDRGTMSAHRRTQHLGQYRYHCNRCGHGVEKRSYLHTHRCHVDASNTAQVAELPVTGEHSVVVVAMRSEVDEIRRNLAMKVDNVIFSTDILAVDDTDRLSQDLT